MKILIFVLVLSFGVVVFLKWMRSLVMSDPQLTESYLKNIEAEGGGKSTTRWHLLKGAFFVENNRFLP